MSRANTYMPGRKTKNPAIVISYGIQWNGTVYLYRPTCSLNALGRPGRELLLRYELVQLLHCRVAGVMQVDENVRDAFDPFGQGVPNDSDEIWESRIAPR